MAGRKCVSRSQREILESGEFADEGELDDAGRAVALAVDERPRGMSQKLHPQIRARCLLAAAGSPPVFHHTFQDSPA
jgi:hypothetical protein